MGSTTAKSGVSLVEVITGVAILGIAIPPIAAMFTEVARRSPDDMFQGAAIHAANSLMEEIVSKTFEDPDLASGSFGTEELQRQDYDDIDDFDGFSSAPTTPLAGGAPSIGSSIGASVGNVAIDMDAQFYAAVDPSPYGGITLTAWVDNVAASNTDPTATQPDGSTDYKRITVRASWSAGSGGAVQFKTLRTKLPTVALDVGPLDELGSAGSAQNSFRRLDLVLVNPTDGPLLIDSFKLESDRAMPPAANIVVNQNGGRFYYLWAGYSPLPTPDIAPNQWGPNERSVPAQGSMETSIGFLWAPTPGPITFTLTFNFSDGTSSVLIIPMDWN